MSEIIFIYKGYEIPKQCSKGEKMKTILEKLYIKINVSKNDIYSLYDGKLLDENIKEDQIPKNENNKKIILVYKYNDTIINDKIYKYSNGIICPFCKESCLIEIKDYKISLNGCKNNHRTNNILFSEFKETQKINISDIICNICKERNKGNTHNNEFYKCLECNLNLCPLCKSNHNNNHSIINYDMINYICPNHGESYFAFCFECKNNICLSCENEHTSHKIITFGKLMKNKNEIIEKNKKLKKDIDIFKDKIKNIIDKLNEVINNIDIYYDITNNIINNINNKNRNYEILFNIDNIYKNNIHDDIKKIIFEDDIKNQFNYITNMNKMMNLKYLLIKYKINKEDKEINIFGKKFVENNKNICKYIYDGNEYELTQKFDLKTYNKSKDILEIKLSGFINVTDMSNLFEKCSSLINISDLSVWNTSKVINMSSIFWLCTSLISLPDISNWDTSNVINMEEMFGNCLFLSGILAKMHLLLVCFIIVNHWFLCQIFLNGISLMLNLWEDIMVYLKVVNH